MEAVTDSPADRLSGNVLPVRFSEEDLALFTKASGDRNPLHLYADYARSSPYGELLVFGYLGALACLGRLRLPSDCAVRSFTAEFARPMILGVAYRLGEPAFEALETGGKWTAILFDGSVPVVTLTVVTEPAGDDVDEHECPRTASFPSSKAVVRPLETIATGVAVSGSYSCDPDGLRELSERWGVHPAAASMLCFSSYVVGMELPGESNLCGKVSFQFQRIIRTPVAVEYQATVAMVDKRFNKIRVDVNLSTGWAPLATAQCWSFVRPAIEPKLPEDVSGTRADSLAGRSAVVVGGSRGLGACLRSSLSARGAAVYSVSRSTPAAEDSLSVEGDAADPETLAQLRERIVAAGGRLDFLVCNAFPPPLALQLEQNALDRLSAYISKAVALSLTPMCALLDLLNQSDGCLVLISSAAAEQGVREWPHYSAAKAAIEMLARVAGMQYPRLRVVIVRPKKLLTEFINTPVGRLGAACPREFAARLATRLETAADVPPGEAEIFV